MRKILAILFVISLIACKNSKEDTSDKSAMPQEPVKQEQKSTNTKKAKVNNTLCKINGEDWTYTKASGIVSTHKPTNKRTAIITFTNKLEKGSETVQLKYDAKSLQLESTSIILKQEKKEGGTFTSFYELFPDTNNKHPQHSMEGTLDLSDATKASGRAEIKNIRIKYDSDKLLNAEDALINVTELNFADIGYSNLN